jgi:hypothetical protein
MPEPHKNVVQAWTFLKIAILDSMIEAQLMGSILDERNIPHRLCSYHDTAYDGLFQVQKGWGEIRAPSQFKDQVLELLREIRSANRP